MTTPISGLATTISSAGNNIILTPGAGNRLRILYIALSADGSNSDIATTATIKFGASGNPLYIFSLLAGSILARNVGAGARHLQALPGESLIVNLSTAETIHVSVEYEETS